MFWALGFGLGLGTLAGLSVGPFIFSPMNKIKQYDGSLDEAADHDDASLAPEPGTVVNKEMRSLLPFTEPWTEWPDYERVSMINRVLAVMWPSITKAVLDMVLPLVKPQLEAQVFKKFKFVEDIVLGTKSMRDATTWETWIKEKDFSVGTVPPRVGGIKTYKTADDEVILETPLVWGSNCQFDVGVFLRFGPARLYIPVQVSNVQFKVESRITIKPLVEEIPCVGGATVTLLKPPHVDLNLRLIKGIDLMALPIIQDGVRFAIEHVLGGMLIYPNSMSFPIMANFGMPPDPKGALNIKLLYAERLKSDTTFIRLEVRKGRSMTSKTVKAKNNSPQFGEEFNLIIDDFKDQVLTVTAHEDQLGWNDPPIGVGQVAFAEVINSTQDPATGKFIDEIQLAQFIKNPQQEVLVEVKLTKPILDDDNFLMGGAKSLTRLGSKAGSFAKGLVTGGGARSSRSSRTSAQAPVVKDYGTVYLKAMFVPFYQPSFDDEDEAKKKTDPKTAAKKLVPPSARSVTTKVLPKMKGVLTVNLIRCINLMGGDSPNVYVKLLVSDDDADKEQRSRMVVAQNSPRWGDKFDFVMINAGSTLYITVYDQSSMAENIINTVNIFKKKSSEEDHVLGKLHLPVTDIARNGRLKDIWTLTDTERGQIELALSWQNCYVAE